MDFERCNLGAVERENELKLDRAAGKIPGEPIRDDRLIILLSGRKGLKCVLVFLFRLNRPFFNRGATFDRFALVADNGFFGKTLSYGLGITLVFGRNIGSDRRGKIDWHSSPV